MDRHLSPVDIYRWPKMLYPDALELAARRRPNRAIFSSLSDHWSTPADVYARLNAEFAFTFDPCPLQATEDGAKMAWSGRVFCNPPYSRIAEFIRRGLYDLSEYRCSVLVFLVPARTDTAWFHDYCMKANEIRFIRGRLKFGGSKNSAPFPSMVVVFREWLIGAQS